MLCRYFRNSRFIFWSLRRILILQREITFGPIIFFHNIRNTHRNRRSCSETDFLCAWLANVVTRYVCWSVVGLLSICLFTWNLFVLDKRVKCLTFALFLWTKTKHYLVALAIKEKHWRLADGKDSLTQTIFWRVNPGKKKQLVRNKKGRQWPSRGPAKKLCLFPLCPLGPGELQVIFENFLLCKISIPLLHVVNIHREILPFKGAILMVGGFVKDSLWYRSLANAISHNQQVNFRPPGSSKLIAFFQTTRL